MKSNFPHILETHLVDHCNLKCKGCSHFAPLVDGEVFADINVFKRDVIRLSELFDNIYEFRLMGGEPLLHPGLLSFLEFARKTFPKARIALFTNGIRLLTMNDLFWEVCAQNNILIKITYYPIELNIHKIKQRAKEKNVDIKVPNQIKSFFKHLNIAGDSDPTSSFRSCRLMFKTPQLRDGKLYPCFFPAYVHIFNTHFNQSIYPSEKDSINILGDARPEDIIQFLDQQIPMCRWCLTRRSFTKWDLSKNDIHEWTGNEANVIPHFFRIIKFSALHLYHESKRRLFK